MPYTITSQCIGCDRCRTSCPTDAIQANGQHYSINPSQCNGCETFYTVAQCWAVCPTNNGCEFWFEGAMARANAQLVSGGGYWESWFTQYNALVKRLKLSQTSEYWHDWFDSYSSKLAELYNNDGLTSAV
ncbi:MAG: 4Fe-4S binding protein [Leptolyngbyaceae bacterium]|nr:4Fe-4S binding protein [Leptolyngbyaceae bacterium]